MKLINPMILLGVLGIILSIEAVSFLGCLPLAMIYGEPLTPFIGSAMVAGFIAAVFYMLSRKEDISNASMRDGYLIVTLSWFTLSLTGSLPYLMNGSITHFTDAFFESASGFTTTGSELITSSSAVASCMAGIGPGLGAVGPMGNYAAMPAITKIILILAMILGRLEIITAFALFSRSFWKN